MSVGKLDNNGDQVKYVKSGDKLRNQQIDADRRRQGDLEGNCSKSVQRFH